MLCVLLIVLMLVSTTLNSCDVMPEVSIQDISYFKIIDVLEYMSPNVDVSDQNYIENETLRNEVVLHEGTPSPENIPSEPTFSRAYVEFDDTLNKKNIFVIFRWNKPKFTNGVIQKYTIQYWFENQTNKSVVTISNITILQYKVYDLKPDTMYHFKVQAHNEFGAGFYTNFINVSTTYENPVPLLLVKTLRHFYVLDIDLQIGFERNINEVYKDAEIVYSALEHKIYGITYNSELIMSDFNPNAIEANQNYKELATYNFCVTYNLCIDWIRGNLFWLCKYMIMKLDLTLWQLKGINTYDTKPQAASPVSFLTILPYKGYLYWSNYSVIMQSDFDGKNKLYMKNNECFCLNAFLQKTQNYFSMVIDTTNIDNPPMYWLINNCLIVTDINGCKCNMILRLGNKKIYIYLIIDSVNIYMVPDEGNIIYILKKKYAFLKSKENTFERVQKIHFQEYFDNTILALDKTLQLLPPKICIIPRNNYRVEGKKINANRIVVSLPEPILNDGCEKYDLPIIYNISVSYLTCSDNDSNKFENFNVQTYERNYGFYNLMSFTEYTFKLALSNFYIHKLSMELQFGPNVKLTTKGKLEAPNNITVKVVMPTMAIVYWMPPKKLGCLAVNYEVYWQVYNENFDNYLTHFKKIVKLERTSNGKFFTVLRWPKQKSKAYMKVSSIDNSHISAESLIGKVNTSKPNKLNLDGASTNSMNITWIPNINLTIHTEFRFILEYKNVMMQDEWENASNIEKNTDKITYYIENLLPRTRYKFRLNLKYPEYKEDFIWPSDGKEFIFETLGNVPNAPGVPTLTRLPNFVYQLRWEPAQANDSPVILYQLEGLTLENNYEKDNQTTEGEYWNLYYNGANNYWAITSDMNQRYRFRVKAKNIDGYGIWSKLSEIVDLTESIEISIMQYYLPSILSLIAIFAICNVYYFYYSYRQRIESNEIVLPSIMTVMELATPNEIYSDNVQPNLLHISKQYNANKFALITIKKEQITLSKFLGRGAFGKVFQGTLKNFEGSSITHVAIKMLSKSASSKEKKEFLREAKFMNHFRHKNVLRLLGICMDVDSPLLILELMEADLLSYLRQSKTLQSSDPHALRVQDLLAMCEDVARGCRYLEKLHFVHRDLACRNCLITARNRENRIVKIGDFGLAKDIYKDDYYRMKGEGLLPVRWMAPESLTDGIFTSKSDVWSFGVLMWEITSSGQQPYCARNNAEVCQYVCAGGKLSKPLNCPSTLYELMLRCWNAANDRPNFIYCLKEIVTLRSNIEDSILNFDDIVCTEMN